MSPGSVAPRTTLFLTCQWVRRCGLSSGCLGYTQCPLWLGRSTSCPSDGTGAESQWASDPCPPAIPLWIQCTAAWTFPTELLTPCLRASRVTVVFRTCVCLAWKQAKGYLHALYTVRPSFYRKIQETTCKLPQWLQHITLTVMWWFIASKENFSEIKHTVLHVTSHLWLRHLLTFTTGSEILKFKFSIPDQ